MEELQKEIICGFEVTPGRKSVWRVETDMLKRFIAVCEKYGLKYVAAGGTLLGAIRHDGFIPWDDDVDIMMPRTDYEKFIAVAQEELGDKYFLQCNKTEKNYPNGHAQIRNSGTTCLTAFSYQDLKMGKNCGVFIDIFPYDDVPDDFESRKKHVRKIDFLKKICVAKIYRYSDNPLKKIVKTLAADVYFAFHSLEKTIEKINRLSRAYEGKTHTVALVSFMPGYERNVWEKSLFDEVSHHKFEDFEIAVPAAYDAVLRTEFGDYMQIPEDKTGGSVHGGCYFDVGRSYEELKGYPKERIDELLENAAL